MKERLDALDHEGSDDAQADISRYGENEAVQEQRPEGNRCVDDVVADDVVIYHAHGVDYQKSGKICHKVKGDFLTGVFLCQISREPCAHGKADDIAEARLEYVPEAAALGKDRQSDQSQQHIGKYRHRSPAATQQKSSQHGEQVLQGEGDYRHGDFDKSSDGNECDKKSAISECPSFVVAMRNSRRQ